MTTVIYIMSLEQDSGKSLMSLGAMEAAASRVSRLGFFRPVIQSGPEHDALIELMRSRYQLGQSYEQSFGVTTDETRSMGEHVADALVHTILAAFETLAKDCDLIIVEGTDYKGASAAFEFALNAEIAANLGATALVVTRGHHHRTDQVAGSLSAARASLAKHHVSVLGFVVNRVTDNQWAAMRRVAESLPEVPVWLLPEEPSLFRPTLEDIAESVSAEVLLGNSENLNRDVSGIIVGAMSLPHLMERLVPDVLVVTPGDRADVVLMTLAARFSSGLPSVAGLLLTGGYRPAPALMQFAEGLGGQEIPVLLAPQDTLEVADTVSAVHGSIETGEARKVASALRLFEDHINIADLERRLTTAGSSTAVTPVMFERQLIVRARSDKRTIVLPEGNDDRVLAAVDRLLRRDAVDVVLLGNEDVVLTRAKDLGLDLGGVRVIDPVSSLLRSELSDELLRLRRHKGMSAETAWDMTADPSWFGTLLVETGAVGGMVSGAAHTTADTVRPALQVIRTAEGVSVVSSAFLMALPDKVLVFADCAVIPDPDAEQLADIAISSAATARAFNIEPRVAMLSYSTGASGSGADVQKVAEATQLVKEREPDLLVEGPIQYDAAVDPGVGAKKLPGSAVAGRATVLVFPDLNTGNNTYKAVQRSAGALAIGPILQGLRLPVNDLSRGATVDDIVNTVIITAIQVQQIEGARS
jgi:phosphate acetyltransferase